jgi:hypothetical protein
MSSFFLIRSSRGSLMTVLSVRLATETDRPTLERLWLMFRHDMSEFGGHLPNFDGTWAFQDDNEAALHFWRRVATEIAGEKWAEERRVVPGQPGLPPDVWLSFEVAA